MDDKIRVNYGYPLTGSDIGFVDLLIPMDGKGEYYQGLTKEVCEELIEELQQAVAVAFPDKGLRRKSNGQEEG